MPREFVFGYGSLAAELPVTPGREPRDEGFVADLRGFVRGWGVAMDNRRDLPGYKYYTALAGARRPADRPARPPRNCPVSAHHQLTALGGDAREAAPCDGGPAGPF